MSEAQRYQINGTFEVPEIGQTWVNPKMVLESDFDRVTAERDAALAQESTLARDAANWKRKACESADREHELQQRLTAADERYAALEGLLLQTNELLYAIQGDPGSVPSSSIDAMRGEVFTALKLAESQQCQFPQACPSNCGCDIPDFTHGNGNKARRRAAAIEALKPDNQRIVPVDPFTICLSCFGSGTICTGILEASSTICNGCNGTGREQP